MPQDKWNPEQYNKFKDERSRPFWDLAALIEREGVHTIVDLGCGTGELTQILHQRLKAKNTMGIDSSPKMMAESKKISCEGLSFLCESIDSFQPEGKFDLVFSNAALQWLDNHVDLIPRLLKWVGPKGQIAIQVPSNFSHPSHQIAQSLAREKFGHLLKGPLREPSVLSIGEYATLLFQNGFRKQRCRVEVYGNPMASGADVIEWTKGTFLTTFQNLLSEKDFSEFLRDYSQELLKIIGSGAYFYPFQRILLWGEREI